MQQPDPDLPSALWTDGQTLSAAARAQQLADVSLAVYEAGGTSIHLPLDANHALIAVLKKALEREAKERPGKEWQVCHWCACTLLRCTTTATVLTRLLLSRLLAVSRDHVCK
jgi:hypothetical protein